MTMTTTTVTPKRTLIKTSQCLLACALMITLHLEYVTCKYRGEQLNRLARQSFEELSIVGMSQASPIQCEVFAELDKNLMTPIDVVVKNSQSKVACIKARFALSIKVEETFPAMLAADQPNDSAQDQPPNDAYRAILGYLPLEQVLSIEDSCPDKSKKKGPSDGDDKKSETNGGDAAVTDKVETDNADNNDEDDQDEQEMIVTFGCGKLAFTFKRDKTRIFVSSIKGVIKLDKDSVREFISTKPVFLTSDLDHHFKYEDIIEVTSEAPSKAYILTANFFFTEIEAFRDTTSRDFILPSDDSSKPYSDDETIPIPGANPLSATKKINT